MGCVCVRWQVYRFQARFVDPSPEDAIRKFVIQLYPQDDTLGISEPPVRNSGVLGGKFLARGKYRKADGCKFGLVKFVYLLPARMLYFVFVVLQRCTRLLILRLVARFTSTALRSPLKARMTLRALALACKCRECVLDKMEIPEHYHGMIGMTSRCIRRVWLVGCEHACKHNVRLVS